MNGPDFLNITSPPEWTVDALCAQVDPELFFPEKGCSPRAAKQLCRGCAVRTECLTYALAHGERWGVWGGASKRERHRMRRPVVCRALDRRTGVIRQLAARLTDPEIATRLGCSSRTVLRIRKAAGITPAMPSGRAGAA